MSLPIAQQRIDTYEDDKYAKHSMKLKMAGDVEKLTSLSMKDFTLDDYLAVLRSPAQIYVLYLMVLSVFYYSVGGSLLEADRDLQIGYVSCLAETCGLLLLHRKICKNNSVAGVSGSSVVMYFLVYSIRQYVMLPSFTWDSLDFWLTTLLQMPQIALTASVAHMVFVSKKGSYQEELDILKAWYLVPACVALALPLHPFFKEGFVFSYAFGCYLWLDVLALLPQVILMAKGGGKVEAPIAHFVAATTLSRCTDLSFWYYNWDLGPQGYLFGFNYDGYLIVGTQIVSLLLVADFMYYYLKARFSGASLEEDLVLPDMTDDMC